MTEKFLTTKQIKAARERDTRDYEPPNYDRATMYTYGKQAIIDRHELLTALLATRAALEGEALAKRFHETYERLAPGFGYETRRESAVPWEQVPERNRGLMVAVCDEIARVVLEGGSGEEAPV